MVETAEDRCGKCGAEIDPNRRVDFTLKDGTRVCRCRFQAGSSELEIPSLPENMKKGAPARLSMPTTSTHTPIVICSVVNKAP
jgi:hypothetical protein